MRERQLDLYPAFAQADRERAAEEAGWNADRAVKSANQQLTAAELKKKKAAEDAMTGISIKKTREEIRKEAERVQCEQLQDTNFDDDDDEKELPPAEEYYGRFNR